LINYLKLWSKLETDRRGVTMLEFAIMGALIAAALVVAVSYLTGAVNAEFATISSSITGS